MKNLFILTAIILFASFLQAQVNQEWVQTYSDATQTKCMALDQAGNIYVGGNYFNGTTSPKMMLLVKYNPAGYLIQTVKDSSARILKALAIDAQDNIVMAGQVNGSLGVLVKYDTNGQWVWTQNVTGFSASKITTDENNNLYITGENYAINGGDIVTAKYSADGNLLWIATFNGSANLEDSPSQLYYKGGFVYVSGTARVNPGQITEIITLKYNATDGSKLWGVLYTHTDKIANVGVDMVADANNNVYVVGQVYNKTSKKNIYNINWVTLKYNSTGTQQWATIYDGNADDHYGGTGDVVGNDQPDAIILDPTGNLYVTGTSYTTSTIGSAHYTSQDMTTIKYSNAGSQLWVKTYDSPAHSTDEATAITGDGANIYLTGGTTPTGSTAYNATTIKYDASGSQQWAMNYDAGLTINDAAKNIGLDGSNNIYVAGQSQLSPVRNTFLIKYSPGNPPNATPLQVRSSGEEDYSNEVHLYPNPVQCELNIESTDNRMLGKVTIFDIVGNIIYQKFTGNSQLQIDVLQFPAGIYYLATDRESSSMFVKQ